MLVLALFATGLGACASAGGNSRTIQVDGASDDFAGTFRAFFPRDVTVKPGMTLKFHQTWSGEPHSVTMGTEVQRLAEPILSAVRASKVHAVDDRNLAPELEAAAGPFFEQLPFFFGEKAINQAAGQPCFLNSGLPQGEKACKQPKEQPAFTGRQSYYSSGFIPYLGDQGNTFEMKIADNAKPGTYFYYCNLHGPDMSGQITIKNRGEVPSQAAVNKQAQAEKDAIAKPLLEQLEKERAGKGDFTGNLAGSGTDANYTVKGQVNEFTPRTVEAKVNEPVTWTFILSHTISFNVPKYVPFYDITKNGTVEQSDKIYQSRGGWPQRTPPVSGEGGPDNGTPLPAVTIEAPKFDGSGGLKSSGVDWQTGDKYVVTFTKTGTYPMACLVHPGMIGKVVVS